ncbi:MAG: TonB-dependent receptor [Hyphomonadaceae bacterium]|nr:TonB-dependent receptor [Hyphomonadaceae bacterium]
MKQTFTSKKSWLLGTAALALAASVPVHAQDAPAEEEDEQATLDVVKVTGIRGSIQNSLNAKKNATSIVEAISAEDIGKLPDLSIADSLARLPGVTAQRVRGRAQQVSIRGLGPDFSLALLNGREVVSSGNNRGIEFDQFPSELIAQGVVYKSPDARLAATGIAGAVDLRTIRPLDYTERKINVSGKYVYNDSGQLNPDFDEDGYRLFASLIDQNDEGNVGWSFAITTQSNPTQFTSRELKTNSGQTAIDPATGLVYPSDNPRTGVVSREFERTSIAGALQFEPSDRWELTIDGFYTDTKDAGIFRGVETPIASWSGAQFDSTTGSSGFADTATYSSVVPILRTDTEGNEAEIVQIGINTSYDVTDRLTLTADFSRSALDRKDIDYESYAGTGGARSGAQDTLTYNFDGDGEYSINSMLDYTDPSVVVLTDPGGWGQVGFINEPTVGDELTQIRLDAEYELDTPFITSVVAGYLRTEREKDFALDRTFLRNNASWTNGVDPLNTNQRFLTIPSTSIVGATGDGGTGIPIIAYDPARLLSDGTYTLESAVGPSWVVEEEIDTFYGMANIETALGTMPLLGNVGFQFIETTQSSTGTLTFGQNQSEQTVEESYDNFLPSLNLNLEIMDDTFIRFAAAQTLTRARLDQLAANQSLGFDFTICQDTNNDEVPDVLTGTVTPTTTCFSQGGGNPFLQPYESTQFDLAFEKYFDETTALAIAVFHKDLSNWVLDRSLLIDGTQSILAAGGDAILAANPGVELTTLSGPTNFADGSISGFEASLRMNLDNFLPENLEGFGFSASYTYADNGLEDENGNEIEIPGYSDEVWSGDVYYENHGFRSRLSARYRSGYRAEVIDFGNNLIGASALDALIVDAQIGYEWDEGPLEGFAVNLEAYNLTDEPFATENATTDPSVTFPSRHELYGTTYNITVSKKF